MLIYPSNFLNPRKVDDSYAAEADAAWQLGLQVGLLDQGKFYDGAFKRAVCNLHAEDEGISTAVYRGWMLTQSQYSGLYDSLLNQGIRLINKPEQYQRCHEFPGTWEQIKKMTPPAKWLPLDDSERGEPSARLLAQVHRTLEAFAGSPAIVKDYVKSEKEYWEEACFIPDTSKAPEVERVVRRFMELRGDRLTSGLVFKKFVPLQAATGLLQEYPCPNVTQ